MIARSLNEPDMFGEIFTRHHDTIHRYVARRAGAEQAPDLTTEVFVRAFRLRDGYDTNRSSARPWLYGIATNIIGDNIRSTRRRQRLHLAMAGLGEFDHADDADRIVDRVDAEQAGRQINQALSRLSEGDRNAIVLYAVEELTYQQISEALGIPIGTIRSRIFRARSILRELIGHLAQTPD